MTTVVFCGPTVPAHEARERLPGASVRGPAARGDVYRAARDGASTIAIIDGYFHGVPSIWHKEILWALSRGARVLGGASLGAIRAAEMTPFGMEGVGEIFRAFVDDEVDDDEVAVLHGPEESGFPLLSTALADIRATLRAARVTGVADGPLVEAVLATAKAMHYGDRSYPAVFRRARDVGVGPAPRLDELEAWVAGHRVEQKRLDALAVLDAAARPAGAPAPRPVFVPTSTFARFQHAENRATPVSDHDTRPNDVLDELHLDPALRTLTEARAALRRAEISVAELMGTRVTQEQVDDASDAIRRARALLDAEMVTRWLVENDLTFPEYAELVEREALARVGAAASAIPRRTALLDQLRIDGSYARLARRADEKERALAALGIPPSGEVAGGPPPEEVLAWLDDRHPGVRDALTDPDELLRVARREHHFTRALPDRPHARSFDGDRIWTVDFGDDDLSRDIAEVTLRMEHDEPGRRLSNAGGWQSEPIDPDDPSVARLAERITAAARAVLADDEPTLVVDTVWLNVNRHRDHNVPHHHPPTGLAAVYYASASPEQGHLCFLDTGRTHSGPGAVDRNGPLQSVAPFTGRLVLFPGRLWHYVGPNLTDEPRISAACNVTICRPVDT